MNNEVLDNLDFQQEKQAEMLQDVDRCAICGMQFKSNDMGYKRHDGELVHERCMLDFISDNALEYSEYTEYLRDKQSIEEIF